MEYRLAIGTMYNDLAWYYWICTGKQMKLNLTIFDPVPNELDTSAALIRVVREAEDGGWPGVCYYETLATNEVEECCRRASSRVTDPVSELRRILKISGFQSMKTKPVDELDTTQWLAKWQLRASNSDGEIHPVEGNMDVPMLPPMNRDIREGISNWISDARNWAPRPKRRKKSAGEPEPDAKAELVEILARLKEILGDD
jgi:hypothetical protein